jgi:type IV secretion system protein VirD4
MNPGLYRLPEPGQTPRDRGRRLLLATAGVLVAYLGALTQVFAHALSYAPMLGRPFLENPGWSSRTLLAVLGLVLVGAVGLAVARRFAAAAAYGAFLLPLAAFCAGGGLYVPLEILAWLIRFRRSEALHPLMDSLTRLAVDGSGAIVLGASLAGLLWVSRGTRLPDLHGSARWANGRDLEATGLLAVPPSPESCAGPDGIFLAVWPQGRRLLPLVVREDRNVLVSAPPRSGKGVGLVIPTLLSFRGSVVVHDIKGENFHLTSGFRGTELGQLVFRFDPTRADSARYNPLAEVRRGDFEMRDAQNVADILVDPAGDRKPDHWHLTAHALLTGLILHVLYAEEEKTLYSCARLLAKPGSGIRVTLKRIRDTPHLGSKPHPEIATLAQSMLDKADEELSGVISTAATCLQLYLDPLVARATSASDFALRDLVDGPVPVSLYLVVPPSDLSRTRPLVRLMINQLTRRLVESMEFEEGRTKLPSHRALLLLDEFPALGRLPALQQNLGYLAGYGVSSLLVVQDLAQLRGLYGQDESISPSCHYRVAFTPNMPETARTISALCGEMTVHHAHTSRRVGGPFAPAHATTSPTEIRRPLLTPDEVLRLGEDDALVFAIGARPIFGRRFQYFRDPEFRRRSLLSLPEESDNPSQPCLWDRKGSVPDEQCKVGQSLASQIPRMRKAR